MSTNHNPSSAETTAIEKNENQTPNKLFVIVSEKYVTVAPTNEESPDEGSSTPNLTQKVFEAEKTKHGADEAAHARSVGSPLDDASSKLADEEPRLQLSPMTASKFLHHEVKADAVLTEDKKSNSSSPLRVRSSSLTSNSKPPNVPPLQISASQPLSAVQHLQKPLSPGPSHSSSSPQHSPRPISPAEPSPRPYSPVLHKHQRVSSGPSTSSSALNLPEETVASAANSESPTSQTAKIFWKSSDTAASSSNAPLRPFSMTKPLTVSGRYPIIRLVYSTLDFYGDVII